MSQKSLRRKRQTAARAMPVETVQTRFRSSKVLQQKKTALDQNEIIKTKYSKTYTRSTKSSPKCQIKERQNIETQEIESNKEFYPNKLKRLFEKKEIVLKPKPTYKLVGGLNSINKRKLRKPTKEPPHRQQHNMSFAKELTEANHKTNSKIIDFICLDDSDSLDEEDLMEILTCPSPVWWEDPPDDTFDEDPISIKINNKDYNIKIKEQNINSAIKKSNNLHQEAQDKKTASQVNNISKEDKNFVARRNKLESLLGNIKSKKNNDDKFMTTNVIGCSSPELKRQKKSSDSLGEEVLDIEILKTLENINIPTEKPEEELTPLNIIDTFNPLETSNKSIMESTLITNRPKPNIKSVKGLTIKKCDIKQFKPKLDNKKVCNKKVQRIEELEKNKILVLSSSYENVRTWAEQSDLTVPSNKELSKNQGQSKLSQIDKVTGITINNFDPNIMIKKVKRSRKKKNNKKASNKPKKMTAQNKTSASRNADDRITVYKIVSEQEAEENNDNKKESKTYNTQMNSYYNQCKNINKSKKEPDNKLMCNSDKESVSSNNQIKSIPVSNNETVKYCLQCSSIFDNDTCNYCASKSNSDINVNVKTEAS